MHNIKNFVEFLTELPDLNEIEIKSYRNFDVDLISRLIDSHKNLLKFQCQVLYNTLTEASLANCREKFENEWRVTVYIDDQLYNITFERKN